MMGYLHVSLLALLVAEAVLVSSQCPHEDPFLQKFSNIAANYDKSSVVIIDVATLLDVELLDVEKVIIQGSGQLVFNRGHDITIKTKGILVQDDAALVIGSHICPHEDQVNIYLEGTRTKDRDTLGPEGDKFIMVTGNANLQIFGQDKIAWTKLASTVERFDKDSSNIKFRHLDSAEKDDMPYIQGLAISVFNSTHRRFYNKYNYKQSAVKWADKQVRLTLEILDTLVAGEVVAISVTNKWEWTDGCDLEAVYSRLEQDAGMPDNTLTLRQAELYDAWALVFVYKGNSYAQSHQKQLGRKVALTVAALEYKGYKVSAVSAVKYQDKDRSYHDAIILDPAVGYPEISVIDDVTSWNVGDEVLLTSSDYAWHHAEVRRIKEKRGSNTLVLDGELYYRHFGEIEDRVDMRGEVALLTRNIKIQGVMSPKSPDGKGWGHMGYDTYGGHIKVHESFGSVHIEGVELTYMGQTSDRGFYPVHFHMCKNITGKTAMVRRNSIHHTFRRAVTVHGTFGASETALGVQVIENVAYDVLGHAYFLEDGAEMATLFQRNLGATIRKVSNDFKTDGRRPAVFWITNPKVIMVGNVASGSQSIGIWYTFPREPLGLSKGLVYAFEEAKHTKLWRFENNVVHSNGENGMFFDNILDNDDGHVVGCMEYEAREDPLDPDSPWAKTQLIRLTAYKNQKVNTWLRGGYFEVIQYSSAESKRGMHIARGSPQQMFVKKSVMIGESVGNHEDSSYPDGLNGVSLGQYLGAVIHDGPTYYSQVWFQGFGYNVDEPDTKVGAIGFSTESKFTSSVVSTMTDIRFGFNDDAGGNRVFDGDVDTSVEGDGDFDSQETATFRDGDGSVTGCQGYEGFQWSYPTQLVVPEKYALTENCVFRENWHLAACNNLYGKVKIMIKEVWEGEVWDFDKGGQMKRHDLDKPGDTAVEDWGQRMTTEYMAILGSHRFYYSFQFLNDLPLRFRFDGRGIERDAGLTVGLCLPENATYGEDYNIWGIDANDVYAKDAKFVDTLEEVMADMSMSKLYQEGRFVYMRLHSNRPRDSNWDRHDSDHCSGRICPRFNIEFKKDMTYSPCFTPSPEELSNTKIMSQITKHNCTLPASQPDPDWGAGDTSISDVDGQWGTWSSWADCCYKEGETRETTRYRVCDNPPKYGHGADCVGPAIETEQCQTPCPVDGVLTEWTSWGDCFCDGVAAGSYGVMAKTRECAGLAHGGEPCPGSMIEYKKCIGDCGYFPED